jgi:hypothetical protein
MGEMGRQKELNRCESFGPPVYSEFSEPARLSWPKTPSIPLDGYDERESECRQLFVVERAARELIRMARFQ